MRSNLLETPNLVTFTEKVLNEKFLFLCRAFYQTFTCSKKTRRRCDICSMLAIKTPERRHWRCCNLFIFNFEHISYFDQVNVSWVLHFLILHSSAHKCDTYLPDNYCRLLTYTVLKTAVYWFFALKNFWETCRTFHAVVPII